MMTRVLSLPAGRLRLAAKTEDFWANLLAWGLVLLYIVTFTWLAILRHLSFNSSGFDLGIYDQVVWNTLHGRPFYYTSTGQPLLHLSNHASFNILLIAPFYLLYSGPEMLLFLQAALIGLGGLPLFWLGRAKLGSNLAGLSLLLAYLLFPTLEIVTLWDFHPPALSVGFFMFAFYFIEKRKSGWAFLFAVLAMAGKEQLPLQGVFLGLYALLRYRDYGWGGALVVVGLAWFFVVLNWVIPANSVVGSHLFLGYYADLGRSPQEIVLNAVTRPDLVLRNLWQPAKLEYLRDVLTPFAFLPLAGLPILLLGAPSFAINLLSANTAMYDASGGQYGADVAPWLAWATLYGLLNLRGLLSRRWPNLQSPGTHIISLSLLVVAIGWHLFHGYSPLAFDPPRWEVTRHDELADRFIAQIPPDASLSAQGKLYPHLSRRLVAYQFPDVNDADYVFLDVTSGTWPIHPNDLRADVRQLLDSGEFGVLDAADGYLLLRRGLTETVFPAAFYDFARVPTASPQHALAVDYDGKLRLLGFDLSDDPRRQETSVRLYWQVLEPIDADLRIYPFFLDNQGRVVEDTSARPLITQLWYPPRRWQPGEIIVTETLPWTLGDGWSLAVGVQAGPNWSDWSQRLKAEVVEGDSVRRFEASTWVRLASFERRGRHLAEVTPPDHAAQPAHPVEANLGDQISLRGYDLPAQVKAGQELAVTLYWQAQTEIPLDYTVFVHLISPSGERVAQHDDGPRWQIPVPTSTWQPGETVLDQHPLQLPLDLPAGTYQLQVGVYDWQTQQRLPILENGVPVREYVEIGPVTVTR